MNINLHQAVQEIQAGKIISYPTEAVYGLGCDPFNPQAFEKLLNLKQRCISKGVILIAANVEQLLPYVDLAEKPWEKEVLKSWQQKNKAITWVLPATENVPNWLTGGRNTLAVRVTHHPEVAELCILLNSPIVSTSANLSQKAPAKTQPESLNMFPDISILEGEVLGNAQPSQIWDAQTMQQLR